MTATALLASVPLRAQVLPVDLSNPAILDAEPGTSLPEAGALKGEAPADLAAARAALSPEVERNPNDYGTTLRYAYLSYLLKDYASAESYYQKAAALGPKEETPLEGLFYTALGRNDGTWMPAAATLLRVNPGHRDANLQTAFHDFSAKRYPKALHAYSSLLSADSNDAEALLGAGWSQYYLGDCRKAHKYFKQVLALAPGNTSAQEGLRPCPATYRLGVSGYFAGLKYDYNPIKSSGYSYSIPVTVSHGNLWSLTGAPIFTTIDYTEPNEDQQQIEGNLSGSYNFTPRLAFVGAYDYISVNDVTTDHSHVVTGGMNYYWPLGSAQSWFASLGGYYSYSSYNHYHVSQFTPHAGLGLSKKAFIDFSVMETLHNGTSEDLLAYTGSLVLGPFQDVTLSLKGYTGKKRSSVDEWGTIVSNNQDLYKNGWRLGASWGQKDFSLFGIWGRDSVLSSVSSVGRPMFRPKPPCPPPPAPCPPPAPVPMSSDTVGDYDATTVVGGFTCRFGL